MTGTLLQPRNHATSAAVHSRSGSRAWIADVGRLRPCEPDDPRLVRPRHPAACGAGGQRRACRTRRPVDSAKGRPAPRDPQRDRPRRAHHGGRRLRDRPGAAGEDGPLSGGPVLQRGQRPHGGGHGQRARERDRGLAAAPAAGRQGPRLGHPPVRERHDDRIRGPGPRPRVRRAPPGDGAAVPADRVRRALAVRGDSSPCSPRACRGGTGATNCGT